VFWKRFISSLAFISLVTGLVVFQLSTPTFAVISVIGLLATWEFYTFQEMKGLRVFKKAGTFSALVFFILGYFQMVKPRVFGLDGNAEAFAILLVILGVLARMIFERERRTPVATISLTLFGFFYVPYLFHYLSKIIFFGQNGEMGGIFLAAYLIAVTKVTDIGAYLVGTRIGRHRMTPEISPKKTWEGFFGGLASGLLLSLAGVYWLDESLGDLRWTHAIILGVSIPLVSVIGDLAESIIKRDADIKDSGGVIPGIGGCLDLIDSLLYTAPLFYFYLVFFVL